MKILVDQSGLTGKVITKENSSYEKAREMWNRAIESYPLLIVYCKNNEDVKNAIRWARKNKVSIRIRSGRHNYEGYSTGNDVIIIDVSELNEIKLDEEHRELVIAGGVRNRELYECLGKHGYAFPGGGCPTVGVVGFILGGGWGYSSRFLGLGCDYLKEVKLIDYEGNLIVANQEEHSNLFWACKGGGGGQFGVVVSMTFSLPAKRKVATLLRIECSDVTRKEQVKMFELWQRQIKLIPNEVNFKLSFYNSGAKGKGMLLIGVFYGEEREAKLILEPFKSITNNRHLMIESMSVLEVNRWIQDAHPDFEHYKSSGRFVIKEFNLNEMTKLLSLIDNRAEGATYAALSCYGLGGKVQEYAQDDSAFYYRNSQYILGFQSVWEDNKYKNNNENWFLKRFKIIESLTQGSFVNFPLQELEDYEKAYYGTHAPRLKKIKKQYDPQNIFSFPQSL